MSYKAIDPRVTRMGLNIEESLPQETLHQQDNWITYEVFHQEKRGAQHVHAGIVHAPSDDIALVFAKEQYGRRGKTANIWVVKTTNILATAYEDSDIFDTTPEKTYREASGYKVMDKINAYKEKQKA